MIPVGPPAKGRPLNIGWFVIGFGVEHFPCTPPALQLQLFFVSLRCLLIIVIMSVNKTLSEWQMHFTCQPFAQHIRLYQLYLTKKVLFFRLTFVVHSLV